MNKKTGLWLQLGRRIGLLVGVFLLLWALPDFSNGKHESYETNDNFTDIVEHQDTNNNVDLEANKQKDKDFEVIEKKSAVNVLIERKVEKLNAAIEEQDFLFVLQQTQETSEDAITKIEDNLLEIEKIAQQEGILELVDCPTINAIRKNIALHRKNLAITI